MYADNHTKLRYNKINDNFAFAFNMMLNYNANGVGTIPNFTWGDPITGKTFGFDSGNSEIYIDGNPFSSLDGRGKDSAHSGLEKFAQAFFEYYDNHYTY